MDHYTKEYSLTKITEKDVSNILKWFNDPVLCVYMEDSQPETVYTRKDINEMMQCENCHYFSFRHLNNSIGYASIYDIDKNRNSAEFSFLIGNSKYRNKGISYILIMLLLKTAEEIGIKLIYCSINAKNQASIKTILKSGFCEVKSKNEYPNPNGWNCNELHFIKTV